ncbi:hypothetical protein IFR05_012741 [Cadophora sp. M221]|nr:hypothetical protein IFR05_012741 [Cadophora sp. M221]
MLMTKFGFQFRHHQRHTSTPSEPDDSELQVETPNGEHPIDGDSPSDAWGTSAATYDENPQALNLQDTNAFQGTSPNITRDTPSTEKPLGTEPQQSPNFTTRSVASHSFDQTSPRVATGSSIFASPVSHLSRTPGHSNHYTWPIESEQEARLFLYFVDRLAPWLDGFDSQRHFSTEVARRAAFVPVIMNAILASAARHTALISGTADTISETYHNKCLQILIPILDDPCDVLDENLCAAIIILRQYEEYDENDERCHLFGSTRMVNTNTLNTSPSSLRDAANWVALRQEIHISLTTKQPVSIILDAYHQSPKFTSDSEDGWANRIVFIFAKVLNYAFRSEDVVPDDSWISLQEQVENWNSAKPSYFDPLWTGGRGTLFPRVVMLGTAQANALQHYHLAKILLAAYDPRLQKLGFDTRKLRKESEENVLQNLRMVIGLATSNPQIEITFMHASHILTACLSSFHLFAMDTDQTQVETI